MHAGPHAFAVGGSDRSQILFRAIAILNFSLIRDGSPLSEKKNIICN
jgi:hypothetical protein